jgi:transposase
MLLNPFSTPERIFVAKRPRDMRAGIQRLSSLIVSEFGNDPTDGSLYVFVSRDSEKAKMLHFETSGWCLYYYRLADGTFKWEGGTGGEPLLAIERRQLIWLLEGLAIEQPKTPIPITAKVVL